MSMDVMTKHMSDEAKYLDWVNNFLTVERFAEYYGMSYDDALDLIETQRAINHTLYSRG